MRLPLRLPLALAALLAAWATAQSAPAWVDADPGAWSRHLAPRAGFTLDLPPGTRLEAADDAWYVQILGPDGGAQLPGMAIYREPGTPEEILARFPSDAAAEEVRLGPGTRGVRVTATYRTKAAGRYEAATYLVPSPGGAYRLGLWEDLAFEPFDRIARSFTFVEPATEHPSTR